VAPRSSRHPSRPRREAHSYACSRALFLRLAGQRIRTPASSDSLTFWTLDTGDVLHPPYRAASVLRRWPSDDPPRMRKIRHSTPDRRPIDSVGLRSRATTALAWFSTPLALLQEHAPRVHPPRLSDPMMATGSGRLRCAPTPSTRRHTLAFPEMRQRVNAIRRMQVYASRAGGREATGSLEAFSLHSCARQKPEWQQSRRHRQRRLVVPGRACERWRQFRSWGCRTVLASAGG
jgi:hypothetical protein